MVMMVVFAAMLSAVEAFGEEGKEDTGSMDRQQDPILIRADRMEMRRQENLALYTGHVQASQRDYRLESRRLELEWEPERNKVTRLVARGEVKLFTEEGTATAGLAVLDVASKAIVMTGSPRLLRGEELVEGDRIIYSIPDKKSTVLGGKGGRVKTRLVPGSRR
jgi:lipopolysaccharide export system protein LptA